ncbi:hypothetical protein ACRRTK_006642 [Alexandromys fortis]
MSKDMRNFNTSLGGRFILVGFSDWPQLELIFFTYILIFYFLTLFGNTTIIALSRMDVRLHTPMYFFLSHLSFLDLCYTTSTVPQLLINLHGLDRTISYGSYAQIARAVLKIKSMAGRRKAAGTCGSHLLVVSLFYGSGIYTYLQPKGSYSESNGKFVALFYTIIIPMLNPLIYTLRNKDVKGALWRVLGRATATG